MKVFHIPVNIVFDFCDFVNIRLSLKPQFFLILRHVQVFLPFTPRGRFAQRQLWSALCAAPKADIAPAERKKLPD
jgi:hypothetical protein